MCTHNTHNNIVLQVNNWRANEYDTLLCNYFYTLINVTIYVYYIIIIGCNSLIAH